ncbi:MAG TPA: cytochrome c oxidase assembly protein [Pirellulales bacterium]|jgi:cytochrome c oxidase assembly factor CtaG/polyferredoxin
MSTTFNAICASWPSHPWLALSLGVLVAVYWRGWRKLRQRDPVRWGRAKLAAFILGAVSLYVALASPIETFASLLLSVHMVQHLILMMVSPLVLWISAPQLPLLWGLPKEIRRYWVLPLVHWKPLRQLCGWVTHPLGAWIIYVAATWLWHLPPIYEAALANDAWHKLQHACFLTSGLIFWYPVVQPFPARASWSAWLLVPYLLLADIQNTLLSAWLTFSDQPLYPFYQTMPRVAGASALDDQAAAGVVMWVPGSIVFLLPLVWIGLRQMQVGKKWGVGNGEWGMMDAGTLGRARPNDRRQRNEFALHPQSASNHTHSPLPIPHSPLAGRHSTISSSPFDLFRLPLVGDILRWPGTRRIVQFAVLVIAVLVVIDGLRGPNSSPMNLAGVVPWIHWRGLIVIGLLAVGNVFCYGCPFMLSRAVARWFTSGGVGLRWPHMLRNKWGALALLAMFFWAYEALALWDRPLATAWIIIAYFAGAVAIDSLFRDATFCKYVCPIGQFNFVQSIISPFEIRVREPSVCSSCRTHDCLRGRAEVAAALPIASQNPQPALVQIANAFSPVVAKSLPGCELKLFQPRKAGNLDCTFCLDCVTACPHDNVGMILTTPTKTLWHDELRSGIGRLSNRLDYAMLALLLVFGAFANAAGMTAPVVDCLNQIGHWLNSSTQLLPITLFYGFSLLVLPLACTISAAAVSRWLGTATGKLSETVCRFAWSLVPLGFAMWMAHFLFHFATSCETIVPVSQRFFADYGLANLGAPNWTCACCRPAADWLLRLEILLLDVGFLASLYCVWRICVIDNSADRCASRSVWRVLKPAIPWAILLTFLFALGIWILFQPMQMRGTMAP